MALSAISPSASICQYVDSGASINLGHHTPHLHSHTDVPPMHVDSAGGTPIALTSKAIDPALPARSNEVFLGEDMQYNLVSWGQLELHGYRYVYDDTNPLLRHWVDSADNSVALSALLDATTRLYKVVPALNGQPTVLTALRASKLWTSTERPPIEKMVSLMHMALGHAPVNKLISLSQSDIVANWPVEVTSKAIRKHFPSSCTPCIQGRGKRITATTNRFAALADDSDDEVETPPSEISPTALTTTALIGSVDVVATVTATTAVSAAPVQVTIVSGPADMQQSVDSVAPVLPPVVTEEEAELITLHLDVDDISGKTDADASPQGLRYALVCRSSGLRYIHAVPLTSTKEIATAAEKILKDYSRHGHTVTALRMDNQFLTDDMYAVAHTSGVYTLGACAPHEHNQNGTAERLVGIVDEHLRMATHTAAAGFPRNQWPLALQHAVDVLNCTTECTTDTSMSAFEAFRHIKPDFHAHVFLPFGTKVHATHDEKLIAKLDARTFVGYYVGPTFHHHQCVQVFDPATTTVKIRRSYWPTSTPLDLCVDNIVMEEISEQSIEAVALSRTAVKLAEKARLKKAKAEAVAALKKQRADVAQAARQLATEAAAVAAAEARALQQARADEAARVRAADLALRRAREVEVQEKELQRQRAQDASAAAASALKLQKAIAAREAKKVERPYDRQYAQRARRPTAPAPRDQADPTPVALFAAHAALLSDTDALDSEPPYCNPWLAGKSDESEDTAPEKGGSSMLSLDKFKQQLYVLAAMHDLADRFPTLPASDIDSFHPHIEAEPRGWKQMLKHPDADKYVAAAEAEIKMLTVDSDTWDEVSPTEIDFSQPILNSMWTFKVKRDTDGNVIKWKARLVVCGNEQEEDSGNYAPTIHNELVRLFLALAAASDAEIGTYDITGAFVSEPLPADSPPMYMRLPKAYTQGKEVIVRLKKSLYGLREAPRLFYNGLSKQLEAQGFKKSMFDPCLFIKSFPDGSKQFALVHVDDILLISPSRTAVQSFKTDLSLRYKITGDDEAQNYLGYKISRDRTTRRLTLAQPGFAAQLRSKFKLDDANTYPDPNHAQFDEINTNYVKPLRILIGNLQWLTRTRLDIMTELNLLAKQMHAPTTRTYHRALQLALYATNTAHYGLTLGTSEDGIRLIAWADASFESEKEGYSRSGIVFSIGADAGAFLAKTFTQYVRSLSTQESEIQALSEATRYVMWFRYLLEEAGYPQDPTPIFEDNNAAISFAKGKGDYDRTKHISRHYHYCQDRYADGSIDVIRIDTKEQRADQFTKILAPVDHASATAINMGLHSQVAALPLIPLN